MFRFVILAIAALAFAHQAIADVNDFPNVPRFEDIEPFEDEYIGYRLPNDTRPETYDVQLRTWVHEENFEFTGEVNIGIITVTETNAITLHTRQLNIVQIRLFTTGGGPIPGLISIGPYTYNSTYEFMRIPINSVLPANTRYNLEIRYSGTLRTNQGGFYRSSYLNNAGQRIWLATTQFESTDARHGFPCYDEPRLKANFTIHMTHDPSYSAISNMPESGQVVNDDGSVTTSFETTPPTSTYLIAFIVSDFEYLESADLSRRVHQRVFSRSNAVHLNELVLEAGEEILDELEDYIGVDYSLPKMDQAAIPDFSAGAMENWGLVTYRESYFFFDTNSSTYTTKTGIVTVVAHEYGHQWFGNLVSPRWWTYIWLNEGFATLMEHIGTDLAYPDFQIMDYFVIRTLQSVLQSDASPTIRPMTYYVESPQAISGLFSNIAYAKSGSVLRMWLHAFTEATFMKGVRYYLDARAYDDAAEEDLFEGLEEAIFEDDILPPEFDIFAMLYSWTRQPGFPLVTVERVYGTNEVVFSQQRYLTTPTTPPSDNLYWIPLTFSMTNSANFSDTRARTWMGVQNVSIIFATLTDDDWLIVNNQQAGYYRVQYDQRNYDLLADALFANISLFPDTNRAQLLDDIYNFARTNRQSYATALNVARFLEFDTSYIPWYPAITMFTAIDNNFQGHESYPRFREYVRQLIEALYDEVGILDDADEAHIRKYARTIAINWACRMGSVHCQSDANRQLRRLIEDGIPFHQNVRDLTYCAAMRGSSRQSDFDFLLNRIVTGDASRNAIFTALGCTASTRLLSEYIDLTLPMTSEGRDVQFNTTADQQRVFNAVYQGSVQGHQIAFRYLQSNIENIFAHFGGQATYNFLNSIASRVGNDGTRQEFTTLANLALTRSFITQAQFNTINTALQNIVNWQESYGATISEWLIENNF
ncbi:aminopeptidase N-like [Bradysia coprophila]|uniref:aminopeptidase N-like n=1 Tax=Bradysia coprophila TaxID=38358 RepID=UPI00187DB7B8|nr:aminopeptidase N-like [Bradysia coprophila]